MVERLSILCPYCYSSETTPEHIHVGIWILSCIHCEVCQSDFDPLDAAIMRDQPLQLETSLAEKLLTGK